MPGFSGIGFGEMLVIGMLVLIVFGPRRLPEISRSMGKAIREFKRGMNEIQRELDVADRESRWGKAGSRAAGAAGGAAVSKPDTTSAGTADSEDATTPEPVIAPPTPGAGAPRDTPEGTAVTEPATPSAKKRPGVDRKTASGERDEGPENHPVPRETGASEDDDTPVSIPEAEPAD